MAVPASWHRWIRLVNAVQPEFSGFVSAGFLTNALCSMLHILSPASVVPSLGWDLLGGVAGMALAQQLLLRAWTKHFQFHPRHWVRLNGAHYAVTNRPAEAADWCRACCRGAWVLVPPPLPPPLNGAWAVLPPISICYFNRKSDFAMFTLWQP
jgi:hypothetical protein